MNTIIISDTHLTARFDKRKFEYLKNIISKADRVIINGDFWDGYICSFDKFCKSRWKELFPLLKKKHTIYLFGNHDKKEMCDKRVNLFSDKQLDSVDLVIKDKSYHIQHGDKIAPAADDRYPWIPTPKLFVQLFIFFREKLPLKLLGKRLLKYYRKQNKKMKQWASGSLSKDSVLICGHSHLAELDDDIRFMNTGLIRFGYAQYLRISEGKIELVDEKYGKKKKKSQRKLKLAALKVFSKRKAKFTGPTPPGTDV